jgi:high-affinity Fe2+/Pb2+ permease
MKRNMIYTALAVAGIASYVYRMVKSASNNNNNGQLKKRSHHMVDSFSKAKKHAVDMG